MHPALGQNAGAVRGDQPGHEGLTTPRTMIEASGLTIREVARRIGGSRSTIQGYLRGDRPVPLLVMNALECRLLAELQRIMDTTPSAGHVARSRLEVRPS